MPPFRLKLFLYFETVCFIPDKSFDQHRSLHHSSTSAYSLILSSIPKIEANFDNL